MTNISALFLTGDDLVLMALMGLALVLRNWWLLIRYGLGLDHGRLVRSAEPHAPFARPATAL